MVGWESGSWLIAPARQGSQRKGTVCYSAPFFASMPSTHDCSLMLLAPEADSSSLACEPLRLYWGGLFDGDYHG